MEAIFLLFFLLIFKVINVVDNGTKNWEIEDLAFAIQVRIKFVQVYFLLLMLCLILDVSALNISNMFTVMWLAFIVVLEAKARRVYDTWCKNLLFRCNYLNPKADILQSKVLIILARIVVPVVMLVGGFNGCFQALQYYFLNNLFKYSYIKCVQL